MHDINLLCRPDIEAVVIDAQLNVLMLGSSDGKCYRTGKAVIDAPAKQCMEDDVPESVLIGKMLNHNPGMGGDFRKAVLLIEVMENALCRISVNVQVIMDKCDDILA